ncbi:alpha/beta fold hydrolase [Alkalicoccus daliensis]|uniref:Pimeloyl-ACP methyl ester carboxylesterase n=1 Tax=Alkalicoccus daliensis TaxID=745820 RepID=A0A1H0FRE6_9BACI|nr:alpha/beta hydrolase [Alkalicoccus daliensis]SDN97154.1 Pimeloyl-ACP methyl ester carboxylesterase [Alkalicoccus daliensis]
MQEHRIEVEENVSIYVEDSGEGKPILFIHGWPLNHQMFKSQKEALIENGYRFIGVDLRGYGQSDKPEQKYSYNVFAKDIKKVVEALQLENYYLAGFSMGGPVAIRFATKYADEQLKKLILLGAAAPSFTRRMGYDLGMEKDEVTELIEAIQEDRKSAMEDFGGNFFASDVPPEVSEELLELSMQASKHATISAAKELREADLRDEVTDITIPTVVMHGKKDEICEFGFAEELERLIPKVTLIPFEESGHGLHYDEAEKLNRELVKL